MTQEEFDGKLFVWLDGELPPDEAAAMEAHCRADADAHARADAERAFDARVRRALVSGVDGRKVVAAAVARSRPRSRIVRLATWRTAAAASGLFVLSWMWFTCIPPFECSFVQALEQGANVKEETGDAPPPDRDPFEAQLALHDSTMGPAERVTLELDGIVARRWRLDRKEGTVTVLEFGSPEHIPSCRRKREVDGETWWVGEEDGDAVVCFRQPAHPERFVAVVGPQTEETLIDFARSLRSRLAP